MSLPITDAFTNSNGTTLQTHNASWSKLSTYSAEIYSNYLVGGTGFEDHLYYWSGDSFDADQYAQAKSVTLGSADYTYPGLIVRLTNSSNYYMTNWSQSDQTYLTKRVSGTNTDLSSYSNYPSNGTVVRLEVEGTSLRVKFGVSTVISSTDSSLSSGSAGLYVYSDNNQNGLDDYEAGNLSGGSASSSPSSSPSSSASSSPSASASASPSASASASPSASPSSSPSASPSVSPSASPSTSASASPSTSASTSESASPSQSTSESASPSTSESQSPSTSESASPSTSESSSASQSPSTSESASPSTSESSSESASPSTSESTSPSASPSSAITGTVCWGHVTGVTETNTRTFADNWTGTGAISGSGDAETAALDVGEYLESEIVETGIVTAVELLENVYASGDAPTIKYRIGASPGETAAAEWSVYDVPFASSGYVQVRIEAE